MLVDKRSLIQFCGQAAVRLRHDEQRNATIVDVVEGSTRALVGPRLADEPLEIHTPVAIAAILGTILSVTVDPVTGDATFALEEGRAQIKTRDPALGRTVTLQRRRAGHGPRRWARRRGAALRADRISPSGRTVSTIASSTGPRSRPPAPSD